MGDRGAGLTSGPVLPPQLITPGQRPARWMGACPSDHQGASSRLPASHRATVQGAVLSLTSPWKNAVPVTQDQQDFEAGAATRRPP